MREVGQASKVPWTLKKGGAEKKKDGTDGRTRRRARPEIVPRFGDRLAAAATPASRPPARARTRTQARAANRSVLRRAGGLGHDRASAPLRRGRTCGTCRGGGGEGSVRAGDCLHACLPGRHSNGQKAELSCPSASCHQTPLLLRFVLICPWTWSIRHVTSSTAHVRN